MLTREQASKMFTDGKAAGLSDAQIAQAIQAANQRTAPAAPAAAPQAAPVAPDIAAPARPLGARIADGLDTAQAGLNAFTNTLTLGSLDRINAGIDQATGTGIGTVADNRARRQALAAQAPVASGLGTAAGIIVPALATAGIGGAAAGGTAGTGAALQSGGVAARVLPQALTRTAGRRALTTGAAQGAAFDPASDEDTSFLQLDQRAQNALFGAGLGGALSKAGGFLGSAKDRAGELATKFLKPTAKESQEIAARFGSSAEFGKALLDQDTFKGVITGGRKKVLDNLSKLDNAQGAAIPRLLEGITKEAKKAGAKVGETALNIKAVAEQTKRQLKDLDLFNVEGSRKAVSREIDRIVKSIGGGKKGLVEANQIRSALGESLFKNKSILSSGTQREQVRRTFQGNLKEAVDKKADRLATKFFNNKNGFSKAKDAFSKTREAKKIVKKRIEKEAGQNSIGLRQAGIGGAGALATGQQALSGDVEGAATAGLGTLAATALLSPRSTAARAQLLNAIGNNSQGLQRALQNNSLVQAANRLFLPDR